jgi:tetratricopeptide (TPR) repeat protein
VDRRPNERLGAMMREANLSKKALARAVRNTAERHGETVSCDHTSVSRWLAGMQPRTGTAQFLCEVLSRSLGRAVVPGDIGLSQPISFDPALAVNYPDTAEDAVEALSGLWIADLDGISTIVSGPTSCGAWAEASLAWLVRPGRDEIGLRAKGQAVGSTDVEALRATTETFGALDNRFGGRHARHALVQFLRTDLGPLLEGRFSDSVGRQLFSAAAEATLLTAWMSYDAGSHGLAQRYFVQGLRLAQAADDVLLAGSILDAMSHQATFLGRCREAANLARAARAGTQSKKTGTLHAHFAAMEARALAGTGDVAATERALTESVRLFEARRPGDDPPWISYFDEAELAAELAHSYRDLGRSEEAVRHAEQALAQPGASPRSDFFVTMVLAAGHLGTGDIEKACDTTRRALSVGTNVKSARAVDYLRQFRSKLAQHGANDAVVALSADAADAPLWRATAGS